MFSMMTLSKQKLCSLREPLVKILFGWDFIWKFKIIFAAESRKVYPSIIHLHAGITANYTCAREKREKEIVSSRVWRQQGHCPGSSQR